MVLLMMTLNMVIVSSFMAQIVADTGVFSDVGGVIGVSKTYNSTWSQVKTLFN